jgi:hypothetical protein
MEVFFVIKLATLLFGPFESANMNVLSSSLAKIIISNSLKAGPPKAENGNFALSASNSNHSI